MRSNEAKSLGFAIPQFSNLMRESGGFVSTDQKRALDILAKYESGPYGYHAVNQIGTDSGKGTKGFSGDYRNLGGRSLTDMTIGEIKSLQYDDRTMSDKQWIDAGKLHAVGRYQFTGNTLPDLARRAGMSDDTKFTPNVQDKLAMRLLMERGTIPWKVSMDKMTVAERNLVGDTISSSTFTPMGNSEDVSVNSIELPPIEESPQISTQSSEPIIVPSTYEIPANNYVKTRFGLMSNVDVDPTRLY